MSFNPAMAFVDCPYCDSAQHVERVKGAQWICNCCAKEFEARSVEAGTSRNPAAGKTRAALQFVAIFALLSGVGNAQPQSQPLVQAGDVTHLGTIRLPSGIGNPNSLAVDGTTLYVGCYFGAGKTGVATVELPALGGTAKLLTPCSQLPNLNQVHRGGTYTDIIAGGILPWQGKIVVAGWTYYDGGGGQWKSHWTGTATTHQGPFRMDVTDVGYYSAPSAAGMTAAVVSPAMQAEIDKAPPESFAVAPGRLGLAPSPLDITWPRSSFVGGYMGLVPPEWRSIFGSALTGQCCVPIIGRTSFGPSVSVFDPAQVGVVEPIPSKMLIGYPIEHRTLGMWDANPPSPYYGGTDQLGSVGFPSGTRSILFTGRHGDQFCYGPGTPDKSLVGTINTAVSAYPYCYDPYDAGQGNHGPPYRPTMWAYDANDLIAVKAGTKKPWDVQPYAKWQLPGMPLDQPYYLRAGWFDQATKRYYVGDTGSNVVHVFSIGVGAPPPVPVDCVGTWSAWTVTGETACVNGSKDVTERRLFTVTTSPANGGKACPVSPETRNLSQPCGQATVSCRITGQGTAYSDGDRRPIVRCDTNGQVTLPTGTTFTLTVPKP
jgi:hypothetical protein